MVVRDGTAICLQLASDIAALFTKAGATVDEQKVALAIAGALVPVSAEAHQRSRDMQREFIQRIREGLVGLTDTCQ